MVHGTTRRLRAGTPYPLGATWDGRGVNFALFSANAERVELCLFDPDGLREVERIAVPEYTDQVWHIYLADAEPGTVYGYRVYGPYDPARGHRFNHHKLLLDPYAKATRGTIKWSDALYGYRVGSPRADLSFDRRDSARGVPKSVVVDTAFDWGSDRPPAVPWTDTIVYEAHLRGLTKLNEEVAPPIRGTYAGLASPAVISHLRRLGVTAVELLPVQFFVDDRTLVQRGLRNYWGYNTLGYFAPDPRYLFGGRIDEFKVMVARLHDAGFEVILDVVYNHTAEGNQLGPTLSFRGVDNASYYRLAKENPRYYEDFTGCGNALRVHHPRVLQMLMDSLRYWTEQMHVDGFRFDLATTLAREETAFDPHSGFLDAVRQDPTLAGVKLIAEPWDVGPGGYQVGGFPPGWAQWNDKYRDAVRRFWKGEGGLIGEVAARVSGSADLFSRDGRRPWTSINFVTAHDGFTLHDLVSYNEKRNAANGEENRDGTDANHSWNCGADGSTDDAAILDLRARQSRNLVATLLLSLGTPMLLAGDEWSNSQGGNNNAYCQDNEIGWVKPPQRPESAPMAAFVRRLARLRRSHPAFSAGRFFDGYSGANGGLKDITWVVPEGREKEEADWSFPEARSLAFVLCGAHPEAAPGHLLVIMNAHHEALDFTLPQLAAIREWRLTIDTGHPEGGSTNVTPAGTVVVVAPRTLLAFVSGGAADGCGLDT